MTKKVIGLALGALLFALSVSAERSRQGKSPASGFWIEVLLARYK